MADDQLQVQIETMAADNSSLGGYRLYVEDVIHQITRQPVVFPIPSVNKDSDGQPTAYALDFGMMNEQITIKGKSKDQESRAEERPSKGQLAELCRTSWQYVTITTEGGAITVKGGTKITINEGAGQGTKEYQGVVQSFSAQRAGGYLFWDWTIVLQVTKWPIADGVLPEL